MIRWASAFQGVVHAPIRPSVPLRPAGRGRGGSCHRPERGLVHPAGPLCQRLCPEQPIAFSHELHAGTLRIPCQYCHSGADKSRHAGIPSVDLCMGCHKVTRIDRPAIQKLTRIANSGEPLPWQRVHTLPDHVFFDHRPHVNAGIACQSCHGEVQTMKVLTREMGMRMGNCLAAIGITTRPCRPGSKITQGRRALRLLPPLEHSTMADLNRKPILDRIAALVAGPFLLGRRSPRPRVESTLRPVRPSPRTENDPTNRHHLPRTRHQAPVDDP